jgi:hypothetical protein
MSPTPSPEAGAGRPLPPGQPMGKFAQLLIAAYLLAIFVWIAYFLVKLWPPGASDAPQPADFLWGRVTLPLEIRLLMIAAITGALGACVHLGTSFTDFAGNERLASSWIWWYLFRPFIGMALAEIVYLAIRGGFFNAAAGTPDVINPYGVAAVTALTGLFSKQATDKLREVFETVFRIEQKVERKDPLPRDSIM